MPTTDCKDASDDRELLAGLKQGQASAFERLMRRYNRRLFRTARSVVRDDAQAQDIVQEAWLRAFLALESFRGDASLATWLTRITLHQALDWLRQQGRRIAWDGEPLDEETEMPPDPERGARWPPTGSPEDEVARRELREQLQAAIDLLPPIYRVVFMLRAVEGLSVEETALALEVSADVVKTRFLRARGLLRTRLGPAHEDEAAHVHDFLGQRCDDTVAAVLARLRQRGVIRDQ